jgi:hypothetical protein
MELVKVTNGAVQLPSSVTRWLGDEDKLAIEVSGDALVLTKVHEVDDDDEQDMRKLVAEHEAFMRQYETLKKRYDGEYVAIHAGLVIDHDPDARTLHLRVRERLGRTVVLLKKVDAYPERELVFRSPRFERSRQ